MRKAATLALLAVLLLPALASAGPLERPAPVQPLVNGGFDRPMPEPLERPHPLLERFVWDLIGSVAPGTTDPKANRPTPGWDHRVLSGTRVPEGDARWLAPGHLRILVSPQDSGPETAVLTQAVGQREFVAAWHGPFEVDVTVASVSGAPVTMRVMAATPGFHDLLMSEPQVARPGTMTFDFPYTASMAEFFLTFSSEERGVVTLDAIGVREARLGLTLATP